MSSTRLAKGLSLLVGALLFAGCAMSPVRTARTIPAGQVDVSVAVSFLANENLKESVDSPVWPLLQFQVHVGLSESIDLSVETFNGFGLFTDVKYAFLPPESRFGLAVTGGLGGTATGGGILSGGSIVGTRAGVVSEYRVSEGEEEVSFHLGASLADLWFFGWDKPESESPNPSVARTYSGDGVLMVTGGISFASNFVAIDYTYWAPVFNDPGDYYGFVDSHLLGVAFTW